MTESRTNPLIQSVPDTHSSRECRSTGWTKYPDWVAGERHFPSQGVQSARRGTLAQIHDVVDWLEGVAPNLTN